MRDFYLKKRRLPTYSDMETYYKGCYNPSFEFDHKFPSRGKYRVHNGVRVYESGYVEVVTCVNRDPDIRYELFARYGLFFSSPKDCRGVKFFTPDSVPVAASAITTGMLFFDGQTRRAYSYERKWTRPGAEMTLEEVAQIDFAAPGAVPVAHAQVHANLPNPERVKAVLRDHKEFFKACATTAFLMRGEDLDEDLDFPKQGYTNSVLEMLLNGGDALLEDVPLSTQVRIGRYVAGLAEIGIRAKLTALSTKPCAFPYLKIVWGDGNG